MPFHYEVEFYFFYKSSLIYNVGKETTPVIH
jgi:hypothetical protein